MEQFSLEKYLENPNRKVVTRDGRSVRIICTDAKGKLPIIALVPFGDSEDAYHYNKNGVANGFKSITLFFADEEEELTEFEKVVQNILNEPHYQDIQSVKQWSKTLLDLARKEVMSEISDFEIYDKGFKEGKQHALESLPKWKKSTEDKKFDKHVCVMDYYMFPFLDTEVNEGDYYIELSDLKTLPKEE